MLLSLLAFIAVVEIEMYAKVFVNTMMQGTQ